MGGRKGGNDGIEEEKKGEGGKEQGGEGVVGEGGAGAV